MEDLQAAAGDSISTTTVDPNADFALTSNNQQLVSSDVFSNLETGDVTYTGTNNQFGVAADTNTYSYDADSDSFSYDIAGGGNSGNAAAVATAVTPTSGSVTATYELSAGNSIDVNIDSAGTITTTDGEALFIGEDGTLSQNDGTNSDAATVDNLMAAFDTGQTSGGAPANFTTGGTLTFNSGDNEGLELTSTAAGDGVDIANASISAEDLVAASTASGTVISASVENADASTVTLDINDGTVVSSGGDPAVDADLRYENGDDSGFNVTNNASFDTDIYAQDDGTYNSAADGNGSTVYVGADGAPTFETTTEGGATVNPLETLDSALNQVDSLRSELGAVQNRFESAITNLSTNETNLSAARSRIEDADYAMEVADMTRSQILQQAGTSVLAQANQLPQNVLSLLG